jgi:hypothetical protein
MVWPSPAHGHRPYAPRTRQTVSIVTPSPEHSISCPLCFQSLAHSFASSFFATPLQSVRSALFAQNARGGYTPQIRLIFSRVYALLPRTILATRGMSAIAFPRIDGEGGEGDRYQGCADPQVGLRVKKSMRVELHTAASPPDEGCVNSPLSGHPRSPVGWRLPPPAGAPGSGRGAHPGRGPRK